MSVNNTGNSHGCISLLESNSDFITKWRFEGILPTIHNLDFIDLILSTFTGTKSGFVILTLLSRNFILTLLTNYKLLPNRFVMQAMLFFSISGHPKIIKNVNFFYF